MYNHEDYSQDFHTTEVEKNNLLISQLLSFLEAAIYTKHMEGEGQTQKQHEDTNCYWIQLRHFQGEQIQALLIYYIIIIITVLDILSSS